MKKLFILFLIVSASVYGQKSEYNTKKGVAVNGYDVTEYFNNKAVKGNTKYVATYNGIKYKFSTKENLETFQKSPETYMPQYGGYCAYAIGMKGEKVSIDPKTFEIRDGKLYLFYNSWGTNTLKMWVKAGAEELRDKADKNWKEITHK